MTRILMNNLNLQQDVRKLGLLHFSIPVTDIANVHAAWVGGTLDRSCLSVGAPAKVDTGPGRQTW